MIDENINHTFLTNSLLSMKAQNVAIVYLTLDSAY
jgi:hypothetical protein